jgi:hypothetical protein
MGQYVSRQKVSIEQCKRHLKGRNKKEQGDEGERKKKITKKITKKSDDSGFEPEPPNKDPLVRSQDIHFSPGWPLHSRAYRSAIGPL